MVGKIEIDPKLFRELDVRGVADPDFFDQLKNDGSAYSVKITPEIAGVISRAIAQIVKPKKIVLGYDARNQSPELAKSAKATLLESGVDIDTMGLCATDQIYFAVGYYKYDLGVMITASHAEKTLNGIKISKYKDGKVMPVARGSGLEEIREAALKQNFEQPNKGGEERQIDILDDYKNHLLKLFNIQDFKQLDIVFDAGNGVAGKAYEDIIHSLPINARWINKNPDGEFPAHEPDPMIEDNIREIKDEILKYNVDFGVAWDGDADRIAIISKKLGLLTGSHLAPVLLDWVFKKHPHATVIDTPPMTLAFHSKVKKLNGKVEYSKVGNSNIKIAMEEFNSPFAAEEADHFMFKESYSCESGILPLLIIIEAISNTSKTLEELVEESLDGVKISGDINIEVRDKHKAMMRLEQEYQAPGNTILHLDGLFVKNDLFHFNIRPSLNDPVMRLNIESKSEAVIRHEVENIKKIMGRSQ
jgi:phosphomannomutase